MADLDFIRSLTKAELHLHLEGSVDPQTLVKLSHRHNVPLPANGNNYPFDPESGKVLTDEDVRELYQYKDFIGFLMAFKAVSQRLRTPEDYELITYRLIQKLANQNVKHAEVYVSVGVIHWRGQELDPIFEGLERGRKRGLKDFGVSLLWIFDAVRHFGPEAVQRVFEDAVRYRDRNVVGVGIGGDEVRGPAEWFQRQYAYAKENGLRLTAHAGESAGPESVAAAVNLLGAERIGHGLTAIADPKLLQELVERQITIEICLSSNLRTGCCANLESHPLRHYVDAGVPVTLNTDDPEMFGTNLNHEYELAQQSFGFSDQQLAELARNSFRASFLSNYEKERLLNTWAI
ncbi:MAG TPA: adenosine deaminase [Terriglobales bacterium]|nr:adenosine deaminase [Terriglobales bacterium]